MQILRIFQTTNGQVRQFRTEGCAQRDPLNQMQHQTGKTKTQLFWPEKRSLPLSIFPFNNLITLHN